MLNKNITIKIRKSIIIIKIWMEDLVKDNQVKIVDKKYKIIIKVNLIKICNNIRKIKIMYILLIFKIIKYLILELNRIKII